MANQNRWLYVSELAIHWSVLESDVQHWLHTKKLKYLSTINGPLIAKQELFEFERKWPKLLRIAQVEKEVDEIRQGQTILDFSDTIPEWQRPMWPNPQPERRKT